MIPKQDRQGVRHARDIEQKYDLNTDFSEIEKIATDAKSTANAATTKAKEAMGAVNTLEQSTETQFKSVNGSITELGKSITSNSENITKLDERVGKLEESETTGGAFTTDKTLTLSEDGVLSVNTAKSVEADNTLPITSAAVYTEIGNIDALLQTI